jgi:hypothetical protein
LVEDEAQLASIVESMEERREAKAEREKMRMEREMAEGSRATIRVIDEALGRQEQGNSFWISFSKSHCFHPRLPKF